MPAKKSRAEPASPPGNPVARAHARVAAICLALPDTSEEIKWDSPHFCVCGKIFASFGADGGVPVVTFKTDPLDQQEKIRDARYFIAPYVGRFGWVGMRLGGKVNWSEVRAGVERSYAMIVGAKATARRPALRGATTRPPPEADSGRSRVRRKIPRA